MCPDDPWTIYLFLQIQCSHTRRPSCNWQRCVLVFCSFGKALKLCMLKQTRRITSAQNMNYENKNIRLATQERMTNSAICFFMHLADTFIQSDLQCIQVIHFLSVHVFPGNWTHNLLPELSKNKHEVRHFCWGKTQQNCASYNNTTQYQPFKSFRTQQM